MNRPGETMGDKLRTITDQQSRFEREVASVEREKNPSPEIRAEFADLRNYIDSGDLMRHVVQESWGGQSSLWCGRRRPSGVGSSCENLKEMAEVYKRYNGIDIKFTGNCAIKLDW